MLTSRAKCTLFWHLKTHHYYKKNDCVNTRDVTLNKLSSQFVRIGSLSKCPADITVILVVIIIMCNKVKFAALFV